MRTILRWSSTGELPLAVRRQAHKQIIAKFCSVVTKMIWTWRCRGPCEKWQRGGRDIHFLHSGEFVTSCRQKMFQRNVRKFVIFKWGEQSHSFKQKRKVTSETSCIFSFRRESQIEFLHFLEQMWRLRQRFWAPPALLSNGGTMNTML